MPDRWAVATGNWSSTATWNGGTLPQAGDDVFADGFTVTIDQNVNVLSIRTTQRSGGTAGGGFLLGSGLTLTATVIAGTTNCLTRAAGAAESFVIGTINGSATTGVSGFVHGQSNTTTITGNVTSGNTTNSRGLSATSGTVNVVGNITGGGASGNISYGASLSGNAALTVTGNIVGGAHINAPGVYTDGSNVITLIGNLVPNTAPAIATPSTMDSLRSLNHTGNILSSADAASPIGYIRYRLHATNTLQHAYRINNSGSTGSERSLYTGGVNLNQPAVSNVRSGIVYGASNEFTGTCAVPSAASVAVGVPIDDTVGTAAITAATIRAAVGLASANLDTQLSQLATDIDNITVDNAAIATAVRNNLGLTGTLDSAFDAIPTAAENKTAVWNAATVDHTSTGSFGYVIGLLFGLIENVTGWRFTAKALEQVSGPDVYVYPMSMEQEPRNTHATITVYTEETGSQYFFAYDSAGTALSLTGKTLEFRVADTKSQQRLYTAKTSDGTLTISLGNKVTFTKSTKFTRFANTDVTYSLRDMDAGGEVLLDGQIELMWAP